MSNMAPLVLTLENAEGSIAADPSCRLEFLKLDNTCVLRADHLEFPPQHTVTLPAFPQARNLRCFITPSLYGMVQSEFFTLDEGRKKTESVLVLRDPEKWTPAFKTWKTLPASFEALKAVLEGKYLKLKHGPDVGVVTPAVYDALNSPALLLAKMALLNLYAVLAAGQDPVSTKPWFTFIKEILVIDRERFTAVVDPGLYESIEHIRNHMADYKRHGFFPGDVSLHYDNIPADYTVIGEMFSVKLAYKQGNVQFTMAKVQHPTKGDCVLLDCDMDEHSNIIEHVSDVFKHVFTGGTHPIDIHEYIVSYQKGVELGYDLRPAVAVATAAAVAA